MTAPASTQTEAATIGDMTYLNVNSGRDRSIEQGDSIPYQRLMRIVGEPSPGISVNVPASTAHAAQ
jgi:hypothetical protein